MKEVMNTQPKMVPQADELGPKLASPLVMGTAIRPQHADDAVHRDGADRVVDAQLVEGDDREHHDDAADAADQGHRRSGVGVSGPAVMATRPASAPFRAMVRSALPNSRRAVISATPGRRRPPCWC
jgi:hypothetical protein